MAGGFHTDSPTALEASVLLVGAAARTQTHSPYALTAKAASPGAADPAALPPPFHAQSPRPHTVAHAKCPAGLRASATAAPGPAILFPCSLRGSAPPSHHSDVIQMPPAPSEGPSLATLLKFPSRSPILLCISSSACGPVQILSLRQT